MKFLVLLSLVAYCTCVPVSFFKHSLVDRPEDTLDEFWQKPSFWTQQHSAEEPWKQQAYPGYMNSWYERYLHQYMPWTQNKETYGTTFPWNRYSTAQELEQLTPAEHLLNYFKLQKSYLPRYNDVSDEDYLQKMLYQYVPEYFQDRKFNCEQVLPQLQQYFQQYPQKQYQVWQNVMQTPWTPLHVMHHVLQQLYNHYGQVPYTREQIMTHIMEYKEYFPHNFISQEDLHQLVEFFYQLQFRMFPHFQQYEHMGYENLEHPWTRFFNYLNQNKADTEQKYLQNWEEPKWTHFYQEKVPAGQEWIRSWNQNVKQTQYPEQFDVLDHEQWGVQKPFSQTWQWYQNEYPQLWNVQQRVPQIWWWKQQWTPFYGQQQSVPRTML